MDEFEKYLNMLILKLERNPRVEINELEEDIKRLKKLLEEYYSRNFMEIVKYSLYSKKFNELFNILENLYEFIKYLKLYNTVQNNYIHKIIYLLRHVKFKVEELKNLSTMLNVIDFT